MIKEYPYLTEPFALRAALRDQTDAAFKLERENAELLQLVDSAKPVIECWHAEQPYNVQWKKDWIAAAKRVPVPMEKTTICDYDCDATCPFRAIGKECRYGYIRTKPTIDVPVEKSICTDCTTPAILCPSANEPKGKVKECGSRESPCEETLTRKPFEKEPAHTSCRGCFHAVNHEYTDKVSPCFGCGGDGDQFRNYTPAPAPLPNDYVHTQSTGDSLQQSSPAPAPKMTDALQLKSYKEQADAWDYVFRLCKSLGMKHDTSSGLGDIESFIRSLAQRAGESAPLPDCGVCGKHQTENGGLLFSPPMSNGLCRKIHICTKCYPMAQAQRAGEERYSTEEIQYYLGRCYLSIKMGTLYDAQTKINDPQDGIKSVTTRDDTRPERKAE